MAEQLEIVRVDGARERRVLIGMAVDRAVLGAVVPSWKKDSFPSKIGQLVSGWCVEYFRGHNAAPREHLGPIYDIWADTQEERNREFALEVGKFLSSLTEQLQREPNLNSQYLIDEAWELLEQHRMRQHYQRSITLLDSDRTKDASEEMKKYRPLSFQTGGMRPALTDEEGIMRAFNKEKENIITFESDDLNTFFAKSLGRDQLVAIMGCAKKGKSRFLTDFAWRSSMHGLKTAYFVTGDMSEDQVQARIVERRNERPMGVTSGSDPVAITLRTGDSRSKVPAITSQKWKCQEITYDSDRQVREDIKRRLGRDDLLQLSVPPSISVDGIDEHLQKLEDTDFKIDVCVIDYADLLDPLSQKNERRDQVNETWRRLRVVSQRRHCLIITATQANASAVDAWMLNATHFSEDRRKFDHVSSMMGINQTPKEKVAGVYRLNWLVNRDNNMTENDYIWVVGNNGYSSPMMVAKLPEEPQSKEFDS